MNIFPFKKLSLRFILSVCLFGASLCGTAALAEEPASGWSEVPRPIEKALFLEPRLLISGSRVHLIWSGTSPEISKPELFHTYHSHGDNEWKNTKAPFFGKNKANVRKVAIGQTRNLVAILFQRSLRQSNEAYEVLLSISSDQGWSWSNTVEIDSYNTEKTGGTGLSIEGRQGSNRPEFAMAWYREYGNLRAANFDFQSTVRPQGVLVGQRSGSLDKVEVGALGKEGFSAVFNNGTGLATAFIKGLVGRIDEGTTFLRGRFANSFSVASRPYGPSRLAVGTGDTVEAFTSNEMSWKNDEQTGQLPFSAEGTFMESDLDPDQNLHIVLIRPSGGNFEVWYMGQEKKQWKSPELVTTLHGKDEMRGFDIAASDRYVYIAVSQGFEGKILRKKLK